MSAARAAEPRAGGAAAPAEAEAAERRAPNLRHRAEYAALRGAVGACLAFGTPADLRLAERLGRFFHRRVRLRRDVVETNLRRAFPERDGGWIGRVGRGVYEHVAREAVATVRLRAMAAPERVERIEVDEDDALRHALERGRGAVAVTGHYGNWEGCLAGLVARGVPATVVVQRQENPLVDAYLNRGRAGAGTEVVDRGDAARGALRALRRGRAVFFVADQDAGRTGVFVPFFGRPASTHRGPAMIARRAGAPLVAMAATRTGDLRYRIDASEVDAGREGEVDDVVERLTAAFTAWLEARVRARPEQYFWLHRRWKTAPPADLDGAAERAATAPEQEPDGA